MLLCPDIDKVKDWFQLKNGYTNTKERDSFSLEVITCDQIWHDEDNYCAPEEDIEEFVNQLLLTQYMLQETIQYTDPSNYGKKPTKL